MARAKLTPAEVVIADFGIRPLARDLDIDPTTVVRWRKRTGGLVPSDYHIDLLKLAKKRGKPLSETELIRGGYRGR